MLRARTSFGGSLERIEEVERNPRIALDNRAAHDDAVVHRIDSGLRVVARAFRGDVREERAHALVAAEVCPARSTKLRAVMLMKEYVELAVEQHSGRRLCDSARWRSPYPDGGLNSVAPRRDSGPRLLLP